jgi:hypothetical protein
MHVLLKYGANALAGESSEDPHYDEGYHESSESTIGDTALYYVCKDGYVETLKELVQYIDPSQLLNGLLHLAAYGGRAESVAVLLRYQEVCAHIDDKDKNGNTALYLAACAQDPATIRILLHHKADVHARSEEQYPNRRGFEDIPPRVKKHMLGYTAIHGLVHSSNRGRPHRGIAEIKEALDLLIDVSESIYWILFLRPAEIRITPRPSWLFQCIIMIKISPSLILLLTIPGRC